MQLIFCYICPCMENRLQKILLFVALSTTMIFASCSSHKAVTAGVAAGKKSAPARTELRVETPVFYDAEVTTRLIEEARSWLGVPYLYGGNDRDGVDCSGFVLQVFKCALDIKLPRTSASQSQWCTNVKREALSPGDLVFFDTTKDQVGRVSHVGLYIGDGQMIHASSSKGVIISSIEGNYYSRRLLTGGKVQQYHAMVNREKNAQLMAHSAPVVKEEKRQTKQPEKKAPRATTPKVSKPAVKAAPKPEPPKVEPVKVTPAPQPLMAANTPAPADPRASVLLRLQEKTPEQVMSANP